MDQQQLIDEVARALRGDADLRALFLAGSLGRGDGDRFSDVDLVAVVEREAQEGFGARWRATFEAITPVVFWHIPRGIKTLVSAITQDWLRCGLFMVAPDVYRVEDAVVTVVVVAVGKRERGGTYKTAERRAKDDIR